MPEQQQMSSFQQQRMYNMEQAMRVEEYGKFLYIEPNNLNGTEISNNIPHEYEDYSMSVNLEVKIPRRDACGSEDDNRKLYFSSDNGTISFFGGSGGGDGEQGYLTTNYTDVSVMNTGEGNKECLGIKNIQISYDSWFFPMVVIDFIDVRGASLMMPQEEAYYQTELSNDKDDITQLNGGSFFKALFSFPQPLFKLTVKGFYGRPAVYNLAVLDFKSNFNSQTGNFECRVQFKGYMYGVYADIPMTYLSVAPYIGAVDKKYNEFWKDFRYLDEGGYESSEMLTYPEFRLNIASAITNMPKLISETEVGRNLAKTQKKERCLGEIKDIFDNIFSDFERVEEADGRITYYYLAVNKNEVNQFNDKNNNNPKSFNYLLSRLNSYDSSSFSEDDARKIKDLIKEPLEKGLIKNCKFVRLLSDVNGKTVESWGIDGQYKIKVNGEEKIATITDFYKRLPNLKNNLASKKNTSEVILYSIIFKCDFDAYICEMIKEYKNDEDKFGIDLNQEKINQLKNFLGFLPSIQNMFNMAFAHMETFVNAYYKMLSNIRTQMEKLERSPSKFGIYMKEDSDLPTVNIQTPPFPLFVTERNEGGVHINKVVPPWEFRPENADEMEEVKFVKELISASKLFTDRMKEVNQALDKVAETPKYPTPTLDNLVPVTLYDMNHVDSFNPYKCVREVDSKENDMALQTLLTFFLRAYYYYLTFDDLTGEKVEKYLGRMEAINFKKAVPEITSDLRRNLLTKYKNNGKKAFDDLLNSQKFWDIFASTSAITTNEIFSKNEVSTETHFRFAYKWLEMKDKFNKKFNVLPVGEFNINNIKSDIANSVYQTSDKYITLQDGVIKDIDTENGKTNGDSFKLYFDGNYIKETFNLIKNADDEIPEIREKIINKVERNTTSMIGNNPYFARQYIIKTKKKNGEDKNNIKKTSSNIFYDFDIDAMSYSYYDFKKAQDLQRLENRKYGISGDGTGIDGDMTKSLFTGKGEEQDIYKLQETNEAKAYLYLMSLPLDPYLFYGTSSKYGNSNGSTLMTMLLREGAFWWRNKELLKYGVEPIKWGNKSITPSYNEVPIVKYSGIKTKTTYALIPKGISTLKYFDWYDADSRITEGRKEKLINLFRNWVINTGTVGFETIRKHLEVGNVDEVSGNLFELFRMKVTIIDTCATVDKKNNSRKLGYGKLRQSFTDFINELNNLYPDKTKDVDSYGETTYSSVTDGTGSVNDEDIMFSTYLTLKNLYDKWFCGKDKETWQLPRTGYNSEKSDFKNMHFIDSYYNDIGQRLICNPEHICSLIESHLPTEAEEINVISSEYETHSLFEFLSLICEKCGMVLMSLPLMYGLNPNDKELMEDMFKAKPYSANNKPTNDGQTYICVYSYKPSEHLDLSSIGENEYEYVNDAFDIADSTGRKSSLLPTPLEDVVNGGGLRIPAFGVTYAKQNQSYFKNIGVNMDNPQVTEASIGMQMMIANKGGQGPRESAIYGQDLYRIYSNYSYTCNVDMMGNSQVMPLMYFQLNNIPMFKGAYMITKVTHNIAAGSMTTQFTGVRQNKNATPLAIGTLVLLDADGKPYTTSTSSEYIEGSPITSFVEDYKPVIQPDIFNCDEAIVAMTKPHSYGNAVNICGGLNYKSYHYCAEWVKFYAKSAGAVGLNRSVGWAWNMRRNHYLEEAGFKCVEVLQLSREGLQTWSEQNAQRADIAVMPHDSGPGKGQNQDDYGHVCMWNDTIEWGNGRKGAWVSDFTQVPHKNPDGTVGVASPWVYGSPAREIYIYRWAGTRKINNVYKDVDNNTVIRQEKPEETIVNETEQSKNEKRNRGKGGGGR